MDPGSMDAPPFTLRSAHRKIVCADEVPREFAAHLLEGWEDSFGPERRPIAAMPRKEDLAVASTEVGEVILKRRRSGGWRGLTRRLRLRRTRAERAFLLGRAMIADGVPTPAPLVWIAQSSGITDLRTCLVTRFISGFSPWEQIASGDDAATVVRALADAVASLHRTGWRHRDLKAPNLLVQHEESTGARAWILDLDGAAPGPAPPPPAVLLGDLGRLGASFLSEAATEAGVTDEHWRSFLEFYIERMPGDSTPPLDDLLEGTIRRARRKIERNRRLGRPLA
jgi:tRNA A-37 threonylcarbamoyl transferase component Bud32